MTFNSGGGGVLELVGGREVYMLTSKNLSNPQKPPANILFYFMDGGWCIREMDGWGTQLFYLKGGG